MHRRFENAPDSAKTKALQTVIEMKVSENLMKNLGVTFHSLMGSLLARVESYRIILCAQLEDQEETVRLMKEHPNRIFSFFSVVGHNSNDTKRVV